MFRRFGSFQWGTVGLCRSKQLQSYELSKLEVWKIFSHSTGVKPQALDNGIIFKVWHTTTLQPFEPQIHTIPLWKDLNFIIIQYQFKGLVAFSRYVLLSQSEPVYIGLVLYSRVVYLLLASCTCTGLFLEISIHRCNMADFLNFCSEIQKFYSIIWSNIDKISERCRNFS